MLLAGTSPQRLARSLPFSLSLARSLSLSLSLSPPPFFFFSPNHATFFIATACLLNLFRLGSCPSSACPLQGRRQPCSLAALLYTADRCRLGCEVTGLLPCIMRLPRAFCVNPFSCRRDRSYDRSSNNVYLQFVPWWRGEARGHSATPSNPQQPPATPSNPKQPQNRLGFKVCFAEIVEFYRSWSGLSARGPRGSQPKPALLVDRHATPRCGAAWCRRGAGVMQAWGRRCGAGMMQAGCRCGDAGVVQVWRVHVRDVFDGEDWVGIVQVGASQAIAAVGIDPQTVRPALGV